MSLDVEPIRTEGLGDSTYVITVDGMAIVADPQRDIDRFEKVLSEREAELRFVLETHIHNDYVSGGRHLSDETGAELIIPAGAAPAFRHRPAFHMEDIVNGPVIIRPIHTPGHTPEHMSYLILVDGVEEAVLSGGSLLVGSAGRSDLLGDERAETLARLQYGSLRRLAALPEHVSLLPTHGEGSFCTTTGAGRLTSTIGDERKTNPLLAHDNEDDFVADQLSGLVRFPKYYAYMAPANIAGRGEPNLDLPVLETVPAGVTVVDARPIADFAAGHLPGALGIELRDSFGTWVGWVTEYDSPLALVLNADQSAGEAARQLARIGYDRVEGVMRPIEGESANFATVDTSAFVEAVNGGAQILDTRAPQEWDEGTIAGSTLAYVPDVAATTPVGLSTAEPVWIACATGYRATIAASFLQTRGFEPIVLVDAGVTEVLRAMAEMS